MFVYAMSYIFSQAVVDNLASPEKEEIVRSIETECRGVIAGHPAGLASNEVVDSFYRLDSAMRESMRVSDVFVYLMFRDVVGTLPLDLGNGIIVPPGTRIVFPTQSIHLDLDNWENPLSLDAFRFSGPFEKDQDRTADKKTERELLTVLTPKWLAFGYGKKACPCRWFVSQTFKQALAYMLMTYDVELVGEKPKRKALLSMMVPPTEVKFQLRRKPEDAESQSKSSGP